LLALIGAHSVAGQPGPALEAASSQPSPPPVFSKQPLVLSPSDNESQEDVLALSCADVSAPAGGVTAHSIHGVDVPAASNVPAASEINIPGPNIEPPHVADTALEEERSHAPGVESSKGSSLDGNNRNCKIFAASAAITCVVCAPYDGQESSETGVIETGYLPVEVGELLMALSAPQVGHAANRFPAYVYARRITAGQLRPSWPSEGWLPVVNLFDGGGAGKDGMGMWS